jgi:hypothetical protein
LYFNKVKCSGTKFYPAILIRVSLFSNDFVQGPLAFKLENYFIATVVFMIECFRYVPGYVLDCYIPQWFHGCLEREETERLLNKICRDGTFLVRERLTKLGTYALSVWCPDQVVHVPLGNAGCLCCVFYGKFEP